MLALCTSMKYVTCPVVSRRRVVLWYLGLGLIVAWIAFWCVMERPWVRRVGFPYSEYSVFPVRQRRIGLCGGALAGTEFAFVAMLSCLTEQVCFLMCFERYVKGAIVLARSMRRVTNMDMVLLVTGEAKDQMSAETLSSLTGEGWIICPVDAIESPVYTPTPNRFLLGLTYTKLAAWRLVEYSAVVMLDLDMMVMRDPTDVFTKTLPKMIATGKTFGAVVDRPGPGALISSKCGTQWTNKPLFNSGTMLIIPSEITFDWLVKTSRVVPHDMTTGDQGYLNAIYNSSFYHLPFTYNGNMRSILCEPHIWRNGNVQILHFNVEKPWGFARMDLFDEHRLVPHMLLWQSVLDN